MEGQINTEINASVDLLALLNYRRLMAACTHVRKVYDIDNDKNVIHLGQRPPRC